MEEKPKAPKQKEFQMNKTEVLEIENIGLKMQMLKAQQEGAVLEICKRVGQDIKNLVNLNPQTGKIIFKNES